MHSRQRTTIFWMLAVTLLVEAVTLIVRFGVGTSAADFNATRPPLILQIHHMFWAVPFWMIAMPTWRWPKVSGAMLGIGLGLVLSDAVHHLIVLPLTVHNTGWHWP